MKKLNKILAIILAILMVMSIIPITVSAATYSGTCGDNVTWTYDSSTYTLTISGTGDMYDYETDNRPWESYEDYIKKVVIEDGVTLIGNNAFYHCGKIVSVILPDSVTSIGESAFYYCKKLQSINIPDGITTISARAFYSCEILTEIPLPDSVTEIGEYAFYCCENLQSINIPNGITAISTGTFNGCEELTEIILPGSVTEIGEDAFTRCYGLTEIVIPDSVTTIGNEAFASCGELENVTIGNGVTTIGDYAFARCDKLTSITIPKNITTIGNGAFYDCITLTNIMVDKDNQYFVNDEYGVLFNKDKTMLMQYPIGNTRTSYTIPDGVKTIGEVAFYSCDGLTEIVIPDGVTTIGYGAFRDCLNLKDITIPDSVTTIGDYVFTFYSILIHYDGTEAQWKQLMTNNPEAEYYLKNNMVYCTDKTVLPSGSCGDNLTWTYDVATGTLTISGTGDMYDFEYFSHFDEADNPWWTYSSKIKNIVIENYVTSIGEYAFYRCENAESVTISNSVTSIEKYAFDGCKGLTSVTIPVSVTNLDSKAFYECSGITDVYYEGTEEQWANLLFSSGSLLGVFNNDVTMHYNDEETHECLYNAVVTAPTCAEQGYTTYTCTCGDTYVDNYVDATGHADNNGDGYCDADNELLDPSVECDHRCHKSGFAGFIWKVINFFNKLFRLNKVCECGVAHY